MTALDLLMLAGGVASGLLAAGAVLLNRRAAALPLAALGASVAVAAGATSLARLGWAGPGAERWGTAAAVVAHPLLALAVYGILYGDRLGRRWLLLGALLLPGLGAAVLVGVSGASLGALFLAFPANALFAIAYALALGEPATVWRRSPERRGPAFALLLAGVAFLVSGPVYAWELDAIGWAGAAGYLPAAPVAVALAAWAATATDALPALPRAGTPRADALGLEVPPGLTVVRETRPKYARAAFAGLVAAGRPGLFLGAAGPGVLERYDLEAESRAVPRGGNAVLRTEATVREALARRRGAVVYLEDLADVVENHGLDSARFLLTSAREAAQRHGGTVLASAALLTERETAQLPRRGVAILRAPDVEEELRAVLRSTVGGGDYLLDAFVRRQGRRREDLDLHDIPDLQAFLASSLVELGTISTEHALRGGWVGQVEAANRALEDYRRTPLASLARGEWPSRRARAEGPAIVVAQREAPPEGTRRPLYPEVERAFQEAFGDAGRFLLAQELAKLGRSREGLAPPDIAALRGRVREWLDLLGVAVDLAAARRDLDARAQRLEDRLTLIAGGDP